MKTNWKTMLGSTIRALVAYTLPMQTSDADFQFKYKTSKSTSNTTIKTESIIFKVTYVENDSKSNCELKLEHKFRKDWITFRNRNCNATVETLEYGESGDTLPKLYWTRAEKAEEFKKIDARYKEAIEQYGLQKEVNRLHKDLEERLNRLLE